MAAKTDAAATVAGRLAAFLAEWRERGAPEEVRHEAKRLLLNQLKASVAATDHPAIVALRDWTLEAGATGRPAHVLWLGDTTTSEQAAALNSALFEVLDFNETHLGTYVHATSAVAPAVLAEAEVLGSPGALVVDALALGLEVDIVVASMLMPGAYVRGFTPGVLVGGVGAAAAVSVLRGFDLETTRNALAIAMVTATGPMEAIGSSAHPYAQGQAARAGVVACQLAARGIETAPTAFEGEKGMLSSHSGESPDRIDGILGRLGEVWEMRQTAYKRHPTETITQAPIDCTLAIRSRFEGSPLPEIERMSFLVEPIVSRISAERFARFGTPRNDLQARFDLRFCAASAWTRGRFTIAEMAEAAYTDPTILALRDRVDVDPDERYTINGSALEIRFADGHVETAEVEEFRGAASNPLTDDELADVFRAVAADVLPAGRAEQVLAAVWGLDRAAGVGQLVALCRL